MKNKMKITGSDLVFDIVNHVFMITFLLIVAYPLYFVLIASFSDPMYVYSGRVLFLPKGVSLLGYQRIFSDTSILFGYRNTIMYTTVGTCINIALTLSCGFALSRRELKIRRLIMTLFTVTLLFNGGMIPTYLLVQRLGLMNSFWAMVIPNAASVFNIIIARTYFESNIPGDLSEAAAIDGCGDLRFFFKIALPLARALTAVMVLFYAVIHWNSFFNALIYLNDERRFPLQLILRNILLVNQNADAMLQDIEEMVERQRAAEMVRFGVIIVSSVPMLLLYPFIQKHFVKGIMVGSLKG